MSYHSELVFNEFRCLCTSFFVITFLYTLLNLYFVANLALGDIYYIMTQRYCDVTRTSCNTIMEVLLHIEALHVKVLHFKANCMDFFK